MDRNVSLEHSAMAVVFYKGRIIATVENIYGKDVLSLPKGHLEDGETVIDAAIRECFEETNVVISLNEVVETLTPFEISFKRPDGKDVVKIITPVMFNATHKGDPKPTERRVSRVEYMDVEYFLANCAYDNVRQVVAQAVQLIK